MVLRTPRRGRVPLLTAVLSIALAGPAAAAPLTVDFDDFQSGTTLTTQYQDLGLDAFTVNAATRSAAGVGCGDMQTSGAQPDGTAAPSKPNWATSPTEHGSIEFPDRSFCARFTEPQTSISFFSRYGGQIWIERANGTPIGPFSLSPGTRTLTGSPGPLAIKGILVKSLDSRQVYVDDLRFDYSVVPPPDLAVVADPTAGVRAGSSTVQTLRVRHRFGDESSSAYTVVSGLPAGVTATPSPSSLPATGADQSVAVTLRATASAIPQDFAYVVRVFRSGGPVFEVTVPARVTPAMIVSFQAVDQDRPGTQTRSDVFAETCTAQPYDVQLLVPPSGSPDTPVPVAVTLAPEGLPAGVTPAPLNPAPTTVTPGAPTTVTPVMRWGSLPPQGVDPGRLRMVATVTGDDGSTAQLQVLATLQYQQSRVDGVSEQAEGDLSRPRISVPRWNRPGNAVKVTGLRLCPGAQVRVGVGQPVPLTDVSPDGRSAQFRLQPDMTPSAGYLSSGTGLTIVNPGGWTTPSRGFLFQLPRASSLFAFPNAGTLSGIPWSRWKEAYGDEVLIDVDPCSAIGLDAIGIECSVYKDTDPFQWMVWDFGYRDLGAGGLCFGHVMLTDWLERGRLARAPFTEPGRTGARDNYSMATKIPVGTELDRELQRRFVTQASPDWQSIVNANEHMTYDGAVGKLQQLLATGNDPWFIVRDGDSGHIVRAVGTTTIDADTTDVHIVDNNVPYELAEGTDAGKHLQRDSESIVRLTRRGDGRVLYDWPTLQWKGAGADGANGPRIIDPQIVPQQFGTPLSVKGIAKNIVAATSSDGGGQLVDGDGDPVPGQQGSPLAGGLNRNDPVQLRAPAKGTVFVRGTGGENGTASAVVQRRGTVAALRGTPGKGDPQRLGMTSGGEALVEPGAGGTRSLGVVRASGSTTRMAKLTASPKLGMGARVGAAGVTLTVRGGSGKVSLELLQRSGRRLGQTVRLGAVALRRGDRLTAPRKAFAARPGRRVALRLRRGGRTRTVRVRSARSPRLVRRVTTRVTRRGLALSARTVRLDGADSALVAYVIRRGRRRVARDTVAVGADQLAAGRAGAAVARRLRRGDRVTFVVVVRRGDGTVATARRVAKVRK